MCGGYPVPSSFIAHSRLMKLIYSTTRMSGLDLHVRTAAKDGGKTTKDSWSWPLAGIVFVVL